MGERPLFTFAVIADSHVNPSDTSSSSPWQVNSLANRRTARVVDELNRHDLAFVMHLGDMVHPVPSQQGYDTAADRFKTIFDELAAPLYVVPGNHDVGDKPIAWSPAQSVTEEFVARYRAHFGDSYYAFDHGSRHFVVLNAQLFNTGFASDLVQRNWLEADLTADPARTIVFLHYPPYLSEPDEPGHYDNIDEPARSWLLEKLSAAGVEAVFAGHVHNFFYDRYQDIDCYILPSLSFVRHDYGEFARIPPADTSFGRNDADKLGYLLVDVYDDWHDPRIIRTFGSTSKAGKTPVGSKTVPASLRRGAKATIGVNLRHRWSEMIDIPYSGGVDEFARKRARNDYPLMALWEMGIRRLRLPLADLVDPWLSSRARLLGTNGFTFTPFLFGLPDEIGVKALQDFHGLLASIEVVLSDAVKDSRTALAGLRAQVEVPVHVSVLHSDGAVDEHGRHVHAINHGFLPGSATCSEAADSTIVDGVVIRVGWGEDVMTAVGKASAAVRDADLRATVHVRVADESPAYSPEDPCEEICRVAEAVIAGIAYPEVDVTLDSFVAHDRGYFPHGGLIDRRYNLTRTGRMVRNMTALLGDCSDVKITALPGPERGWVVSDDVVTHVLLLPEPNRNVSRLPKTVLPPSLAPTARVVDLANDEETAVELGPVGDLVKLDESLAIDSPRLLTCRTSGEDNTEG